VLWPSPPAAATPDCVTILAEDGAGNAYFLRLRKPERF